MKKVYKLENLECAHCASKMEEGIKKIDGVEGANVNFMAQKLTIDVQESRLDSVLEEIKKLICRIEPDCTLKA
ncbi:MAG: cation transporter [Peptococcaceae bacterium]|nr:cation transporter [Peptococcaceae bacterium]